MTFPIMEFNQTRWNRLLLNSYWIMLILSIVIESSYLFVTEVSSSEFIGLYIVRPTLMMTAILILTELSQRLWQRYSDYILITTSAALALTTNFIHSTVEYLILLLFFPIVISIFYFQYSKLLYSVVIAHVSLVCLYTLNDEMNNSLTSISLLAILFIMLTFSYIAFGVLARGREILINLRSTSESNQELLVRTILMDKLVKTDALTETYNHMAYHEFMENMVQQAESGRMKLHLAIMDIDNFKSVNDTYGHKAGDVVLRKVAAIAKAKVGSNDVVARYGGEEFAIIFAEKDFQEVYDILENIRMTLASTSLEVIDRHSVTISIGLNRFAIGMDKEALFQGADAALYEAKHSGKNRTVIANRT
ncbi:MAG: GGDEF domain-containing protein [Candidatus Cohnella colombiensis]|uniref:GGDEF domain-containing protein n=1 Tax=Candidatus Cohnella colombiensis TaxID=3121368 RepID=A0AA95JBA8_9BACL|nr:MAG: GGDEF domain-containing protein [Cohnella sp.]